MTSTVTVDVASYPASDDVRMVPVPPGPEQDQAPAPAGDAAPGLELNPAGRGWVPIPPSANELTWDPPGWKIRCREQGRGV